MKGSKLIPLLFVLAGVSSLPLQAQTDSLFLEESVLISRKNESMLKLSEGAIKLDAELLKTTPAFLGSTDPLRISRYLPSMQASSEIDAGIHIQGNDHSHNLISSGGVPIYGASHLFGLFSVFNPSHFSAMDYSTTAPEANRLGGKLDIVLPQAPAQKFGGEFSMGLLAAGGSVTVPTGKVGSFTASVRRSYLNLLYGKFLRIDSSNIKYGFTDANLTGIWRLSDKDKLWVDAYYGDDAVILTTDFNTISVDLPWRNAMAAIHHSHSLSGGAEFRHKAFVTHYGLSPVMSYAAINFSIPSKITTAGYDLQWRYPHLHFGGSFLFHVAHPQQVYSEGSYFGMADNPEIQYGQEGTVYARYMRQWGDFDLDASMKAILWHGPDGKWVPELSPEVTVGWDFHRGGKLSMRLGLYHQNLSQAGFTGIGLPFEFWMLAGTVCGPQRSLGASIQHQVSFWNDSFSLSAELYYKILENQVEYRDGLVDIISSPYSLEGALRSGKGRAFGINMMLHKKSGPVTGWLSLSWGRSLRTFSPEEGELPAFHERTFEADLVASYKLGRWVFSLTSLAATGTPYTPATDIYLLSNYLLIEYGPHNSARLPWYLRTDIGVTCNLGKTGIVDHALNFSMYNVFGAKNPLYRNLSISDTGFKYSFEGIGIRFMPSIGYSLKF